MTIFDAILQGIIQGLTEFLPVSSSGHLSLAQYFTGRSGEEGLLFIILLHIGTLFAVLIAFRQTLWVLILEFIAMIGDIFRGRFSFRGMSPKRRMIILLIVSLIPMAVVTFPLRGFFTAITAANSILVEGLAFLLTSALLFLSCRCHGRKTARDMRYKDALAIGFMQSITPIPGLSRSGSTITAGLLMGLERKYAFEFSFIMSIPVVTAAYFLEFWGADRSGMDIPTYVVIIGIFISLIVGLLAIKILRWVVVSDKFKYFAWYMLVLGILTTTAAVIDMFTDHALQRFVLNLSGG